MSLRNQVLLVGQALQYVANPVDSAGVSPTAESPALSNNGTQVAAWLVANGQTAPNPWQAAFVLAVYRNLLLDSEVGVQISPEAIWRSAFAKGLISPRPIRGAISLLVRINAQGILDEISPYADSKAGIFARFHEDERQILVICGNERTDDNLNDGVVMRFYDHELPVEADSTIRWVFVAPAVIRYAGGREVR